MLSTMARRFCENWCRLWCAVGPVSNIRRRSAALRAHTGFPQRESVYPLRLRSETSRKPQMSLGTLISGIRTVTSCDESLTIEGTPFCLETGATGMVALEFRIDESALVDGLGSTHPIIHLRPIRRRHSPFDHKTAR